ncbi:hypothetical protein MLD38_031376 [Melastoma candidum]|uniref:Uncharacterized protein n=1 Tax=Melastoma candidum TaxID=119954 RepID=A0ACB9MRK3_9MYRT|nr:hypothetical protein MLD38_031376 [Melastoma candidum]
MYRDKVEVRGNSSRVYLDKTMHKILCDALFVGLTNPKHERKVQDILATICNGAVETLKGNGWVNKVSSTTTLAVPSNWRLMVDLNGRVTYETVRSMLEFMMEKSYEGMRQKVDAVQDAVIDKGIDVVRYVTAKSSVVTTICRHNDYTSDCVQFVLLSFVLC